MSKQAEHAIEYMFMLERSMLKQICDSKQPPTPAQRLRLAAIVDDAISKEMAKLVAAAELEYAIANREREVGL